MSSSKTYEVTGETTEWDDILIKKGITTKENVLLAKGLNPLDFVEKEEAADEPTATKEEMLENATLDDLDDLEEEDPDDGAIQQYRQKRIEELQRARIANRFGAVHSIAKDEWIKEVNEASVTCWVVILLYSDSVEECGLLENALVNIAAKFPQVKFVKIRSTSAVENWPDRNLPTLFVYKDGELQHQLMTLRGLGGSGVTPADVEWWLASKGVVETELEEDPRLHRISVARVSARSMHSAVYDSDEEL